MFVLAPPTNDSSSSTRPARRVHPHSQAPQLPSLRPSLLGEVVCQDGDPRTFLPQDGSLRPNSSPSLSSSEVTGSGGGCGGGANSDGDGDIGCCCCFSCCCCCSSCSNSCFPPTSRSCRCSSCRTASAWGAGEVGEVGDGDDGGRCCSSSTSLVILLNLHVLSLLWPLLLPESLLLYLGGVNDGNCSCSCRRAAVHHPVPFHNDVVNDAEFLPLVAIYKITQPCCTLHGARCLERAAPRYFLAGSGPSSSRESLLVRLAWRSRRARMVDDCCCNISYAGYFYVGSGTRSGFNGVSQLLLHREAEEGDNHPTHSTSSLKPFRQRYLVRQIRRWYDQILHIDSADAHANSIPTRYHIKRTEWWSWLKVTWRYKRPEVAV